MDRNTIEFHRKCVKALTRISGPDMSIQLHKDAIRALQAKKKSNDKH